MPASASETPASAGLFAQLAALLSAKLAYLRVRLELLGIESKEALANGAIILALVAGALVVVVFGYLFLVIALVFLIAWALGGGNAWIWVMLGAGVLHVLGAVALVFLAKMRFSRPMFPATIDEFKKDQQWLMTPANRN